MTEDEILELTAGAVSTLWEKDSKIDYTEVGQEAAKTGSLHAKYSKILFLHKGKLREMNAGAKKVRNIRQSYYDGSIDQETEKKYGWAPFPYKVLKNDIDRFLDADDFVQKAEANKAKHEDIVDLCSSIIKEISNRSYQLKSAVDWQKLMAGFNA